MRLPKDFLGITLYDGPSLIDGKPILAIANSFKRQKNKKIGKMIKVWIIRKDIDPISANNIGEDFSVCGTCKHREFRTCYVNLAHGPNHVYEAYHRGRYETYTESHLELFKGKDIRLGSYGDPAAVPIEVWDNICSVASGQTGYSHIWQTCDQELKKLLMASVDTESEYFEAIAKGWRTFRVRGQDDPILDGERICRASKEGGQKTSCAKCRACRGRYKGCSIKNITIIVHGVNWKLKSYYKNIKQLVA